MRFQILYEDEADPSNLLWHTICDKVQIMKLEGNGSHENSTRLVGKLVDDPLWFELSFLKLPSDFSVDMTVLVSWSI